MAGENMPGAQQRILANEQIKAFHHDEFVEDQVSHFIALFPPNDHSPRSVVDMGGGCGYFARRLAELAAVRVRVVDSDPGSVEICRGSGIAATVGDALHPFFDGDEDVACFNLLLHHLIGPNEAATVKMQRDALAAWHGRARALFVNEYVYESYIADLSGWLIFQVTKSMVLSWIGRRVASVIPAFKANTFGVGVRFRSHKAWDRRIFRPAGYTVQRRLVGRAEPVPGPLRLLLIRAIRRDSFMLVAGTGHLEMPPGK